MDTAIGPSFQDCWGCLAKGCAMQFDACAQDCACNTAVVSAIDCINGGGTPLSCSTPALSPGGGSGITSLTNCLLTVGSECNCGGSMVEPPDASTCVMTGGGSTAGAGACSSTIEETCGGTEYQAVCACPQGRCVCFGDTTTVIPIGGCPYCPNTPGSSASLSAQQVLSMCGFPQ